MSTGEALMDQDSCDAFQARTSALLQAIDEWIAEDRELISMQEKLKRRFVFEAAELMAMRRSDAANLFDTLFQDRQVRAGLIDKVVGPSSRLYVYRDVVRLPRFNKARRHRECPDCGHIFDRPEREVAVLRGESHE